MPTLKFIAAACMAALLTVPAHAAEPPSGDADGLAPDLYVNGVAVSKNQVELFMQSLLANNGDQEKGDVASRRQAARKELASQEALTQLAVAEGLDKDREVADALQYARREVLARVYIQHYFANNPVSNEMLKASYEWNRSNGKIMEYKVRQILLPTREDAEKVLARLKKGEDFVALTKLSRDPGGNSNGGLVAKDGWFRTDIFVDPYFSDEVEKLAENKGRYSSEPVRTRFGWHIVRVDESRPLAHPEAFEKLHPSVLEAMRQKTAQRKLNELIASAANNAKLTNAEGKAIDYSTLQPKR